MAGYATSVEVLLQHSIPARLAAAARGLMTAETHRRQIEEGFRSWNTAIIGFSAAFAGMSMIKGLEKLAQASRDLLDVQAKLVSKGISIDQIDKLKKEFFSDVASKIPTASLHEYLSTIAELRAITGADPAGLAKAASLAPKAIMANELIANLSGRASTGAGENSPYYQILRSEELKGIATNDEEREALTDQIFSYVEAFHGKLKPSDFLQAAKLGGTAWKHLKPLQALGPMAVLIAELGSGELAGRSLKTLEQIQMGTGQALSHQQFDILNQAKLIRGVPRGGSGASQEQVDMGGDPDAYKHFKDGGGDIVGSKEYIGDIPGWIREVVAPAIHVLAEADMKAGKGEGATSVEQRYDHLMQKVFRFRNAQKLAMLFSDPGFLNQTMKDIGVAAKVKSIDEAYRNYYTHNPVGAERAFHQTYKSFTEAAGAPLMQAAMPIMQKMIEAFQGAAKIANANPEVVRHLAIGIGVLATAFTAAGAIALIVAIGPVGFIAAWIISMGALASNFNPVSWHLMISALKNLGKLDGKAFFSDMKRLGDVIYDGIIGGLTKLWDAIKASISNFLGSLIPNAPNKRYWNAPNPFLIPKDEGGFQRAAFITQAPLDTVQVDHKTTMTDGTVVAENTGLYQEASFHPSGDPGALPDDFQSQYAWPETQPSDPFHKGWEPPPRFDPDAVQPQFHGGYKPYSTPHMHPNSDPNPIIEEDGTTALDPGGVPLDSRTQKQGGGKHGKRHRKRGRHGDVGKSYQSDDTGHVNSSEQQEHEKNVAGEGTGTAGIKGKAGAQSGPVADRSKGAPLSKNLKEDRVKFAKELEQKPWLKEKIFAISAGENLNPAANQAVMESMMNRASIRNRTLEQEAKWTSEHGYYDDKGTRKSGHAGQWASTKNKEHRDTMQRSLDNALGGGNVSKYATENASAAWGEARLTGKAGIDFAKSTELAKEKFGYPSGSRGGPAGWREYPEWRKRMGGGDTVTTSAPNTAQSTPSTTSGVGPTYAVQTDERYTPLKPGSSRFGNNVGSDINPTLLKAGEAASKGLPEGFMARAESGHRTGGHGEHTKGPHGNAVDFGIYNKEGHKLDWYQNPQNYAIYQKFAHDAYNSLKQTDPAAAARFRWGGYFGGSIKQLDANGRRIRTGTYGAMDLMHHDLGGPGRMATGNMESGLYSKFHNWARQDIGGSRVSHVQSQGSSPSSQSRSTSAAGGAAGVKGLPGSPSGPAAVRPAKAVPKTKADIVAALGGKGNPANTTSSTSKDFASRRAKKGDTK